MTEASNLHTKHIFGGDIKLRLIALELFNQLTSKMSYTLYNGIIIMTIQVITLSIINLKLDPLTL